jgi:hypothetical protein
VQPGRQPGYQHRVLGIGLLGAVVLLLTRPAHRQRLDTHHRQPTISGHLLHDLPPVPGRLTRHGHRGIAGPASLPGRPIQQATQLPRLRGDLPPLDHPRVPVTQHRVLPFVSKIDGQNRVADRDQLSEPAQTSVTPSIRRGQPTTLGQDVLLDLNALGHQARIVREEDVFIQTRRGHVLLPTPGTVRVLG